MIIEASSTRSQGLRCIIPISPSRIPQTSLARRADHPPPPGCRRRENPGPRAHRGCRERDAAQLLLRRLGARCCHHPWLHRIRAEFVVGACLMAEIISMDRKLSENVWVRGVYGSSLPSDCARQMFQCCIRCVACGAPRGCYTLSDLT